ncbi:zinc finger protein 888-like [Malaya genurostris]|uniref:zinc finger protein 888-like n=1 Tax=Malaya genurostris TaxID=325434 RepID=UPI0026F3FA03|nr:zinc finger protein 888-like [Malaya genurostris]
MPCIVPTCDSSCQGRLKRFPNNHALAERWLEAVQLGCGVGIQTTNDLSYLEICDLHFQSSDGAALNECSYQEPSRFTNCEGIYVEVSSCRLCLAFHNSADMVHIKSTLGETVIASHVAEYFNITFRNRDILQLVCQECLVQIDMLSTVKQRFAETENAYQQLVRMGLEQEQYLDIKIKFEQSPMELVMEDVPPSDFYVPETVAQEGSSEDYKPEESEILTKMRRTRRRRNLNKIKKDQKRGSSKPPINLVDNAERKCYICVTVCEDANDLVLHLTEKHTSKEGYRCNECSLDIPGLAKYNRHLSRHDETERPHKCNVCPLRFASLLQCKSHENKIHGAKHDVKEAKHSEKVRICEICGKEFTHKGRLKDHIRKVHLKVGIPKCSICNKIFTAKNSLERHMLLHTNEKPYTCDQCGMSFRRLLNMRHHKSMVHEGKNPHVCTECNMEFKGYQALYWHRQSEHLQRPKREMKKPACQIEVCKLCQLRLGKVSELVEHIQQEHSGVEYPLIKCVECPKTFLTSSRLSQHKSVHTDKYACKLCGARHCDNQRLQFHMDSKHSDGRTFDCPTCGKTFKTERHLATHVALHTKEKRFQCEFCPKVFGRKCQLIIHRRTHTGEKPFQCIGCLQRFGDDGTFCKHKKRCQAFIAKNEQQIVRMEGEN